MLARFLNVKFIRKILKVVYNCRIKVERGKGIKDTQIQKIFISPAYQVHATDCSTEGCLQCFLLLLWIPIVRGR